jgi:hypothetical protein
MAAKLVPTVRTSYTEGQLIEGFVAGWQQQFNEIPSKQSIGVLYAQDALETGTTIDMWNNNIGNVKYVASANPAADTGIEYMMLANVWEMVNGQKVVYQPPSPVTWFRAFDTLASGIAFQLDFLKNHRYKAAWAAVLSGDPAGFAHLLKVAGYYSAPEADYVKLMNYYFNKYMATNYYELAAAKLQPAPVSFTVDPTPPSDPTPPVVPIPPVAPVPPPIAPPPVETLPEVNITGAVSVFQQMLNFLRNIFKKR